MEKLLHTKWGKAKIVDGYYRITSTKEGNGNEFCRYSYYGLGILRCSFHGLEGYQCIGRNDCIHFEYCDLEVD